jgi:hypothetical protein
MPDLLVKRGARGLAALGLALALWQHLALASRFSPGFFLLSLAPYTVCLVALARMASPVPAFVGCAIALALAAWNHYHVFVAPTSSTAALGMIFVPLWSALIFCPLAMLVAWLLVRWRRGGASSPR